MSGEPSHWRRETVTTVMEDVLCGLATLLPSGTYVAGGTGLALSLGHRRSVDLDLFVPAAFDEEQLLPIADPRDIACMKITAIASRGTKRDFVDFHACCRAYGLPELLGLFQRKYAATAYSMTHVLKSLTYFDDAEKEPLPDMLAPLAWSEVREFFQHEAPRVL